MPSPNPSLSFAAHHVVGRKMYRVPPAKTESRPAVRNAGGFSVSGLRRYGGTSVSWDFAVLGHGEAARHPHHVTMHAGRQSVRRDQQLSGNGGAGGIRTLDTL
jgi:hypothetical protein